MREDATLMDAAAVLAEHFKIPQKQIQFLVNGSEIDDLSTRIWSQADSIEFAHHKRLQAFEFETQRLDLLVDFDAPVSELLSLISDKFNISASISILYSGAEIDPEMTLADLDPDEPLEIRLSTPAPLVSAASPVTSAPASPTASYSIVLLLGIIPRVGIYQLAPTATLEEVEVALMKRFDLGDLELEFGLLDIESDETTIIPKSTVIGQLDLKKFSLIARPSETFECSPVSSSVNESGDRPACESDADGGGMLQSICLTVGGAASSSKVYEFFCDSLHQALHLRLPPGATVKQAKEAVASQYGKPPEAVFLHFLGNELRDHITMERLRLGTAKVTVSF
jgi:hypothetical protein